MRVVDRLGSLQFDPLDVTGRNHDLVLAARIRGYERAWTDALLYDERRLFEAYNKGLSLLPTPELPWYRVELGPEPAGPRGGRIPRPRPARRGAARADPGRTARSPPATSPPRAAIDWYWRPTNQVRAILEALAEAGILGLARRDGNRRVYDLIERLFPAELLAERHPEREQRRHKLLSRYRAHGLLGRSGSAELWTGHTSRSAGSSGTTPGGRAGPGAAGRAASRPATLVPVTVEGVRGDRFVLAEEVGLLEAPGPRRGSARRRVPGPARPVRVGPRVPALAVRLRLRLGGLRPAGQAPLGVLRPADPVRRPAGRADRAAGRSPPRRAPRDRRVVGARLRSDGAKRGSSTRSSTPSRPTRGSSVRRGSTCRGSPGIVRWRRPFANRLGSGGRLRS